MATHKQTKKGPRRSSAPRQRKRVTALDFGRERFRFTLRREQRRLRPLNIDPYVEHANWGRESAIKTGELNFRRPLTGMQAGAIAQGDRVRCEVDLHGNGQWRRLWHMTVDTPNHQIAGGIMSMALKAELKAAQESKAAFKFKGKNARQITLAVAKRFHLTVGTLPKATHKIDKLVRKSASPVDVITAAWKAERTATGRRFDIDLSRGQIDVNELREPAHMLLVGDAILDAAIKHSLRRMCSAVVVTSTRREGGRKKKLKVKVVDHARVRRYGYIVRHVNKPGLKTTAACRRHGREYLARLAKPTEDLTFSHPGLPFLDRGDSMRVTLADADLRQVVCYVKSTNHEVSAGSYTMDVVVGFTDPWIDARKERAKRKREAAARRRRRESRGRSRAPEPAKAGRRR